MRPYYCKASDNENEAAVLRALSMRLNFDSAKFNQGRAYSVVSTGDRKHCPFDGEVSVNGKLFALVEIKRRNGDSSRYAEWHISQNKIVKARIEAIERNVPLWLVFKWDDGIFMADVAKLDLSRTHVSGRFDRGDAADEEVMVLMDSKQFKRV